MESNENDGQSFNTDSNRAVEKKINFELHFAAHYGDCEKIKVLVERGFDREAKDDYGRTPLLRAALKGHVDAFDLLLRLGANFNAHDEYLRNSTHLAARAGHLEILKQIMKYVGQHNRQNIWETTPERLGSSNGSVKTFLNTSSEFDINLKDKTNRTALNLALENENTECVNFLKLCGADPRQEGYTTELHFAAHDGDCEKIKVLVERGFDREAKDDYGRTPLLRAALKGHVDAFDLLLRLGADFNARDNYKRCAEHLAAKENHWVLLEWIMEWATFDVVNTQDDYGRTPGHLAALKGRKETLFSILSTEFKVNSEDSWGRTPLHLARKEGYPKIANFLEKYGADPESEDIHGRIPTDME